MPRLGGQRTNSRVCELLLLGVEHEYRVLDEHARRLGAAPMLRARGGTRGRRIDPGDANAWRTADSSVLTVDGDEAEMASPLLHYDADLGRALSVATRNGTSALADIASPFRLVGYSTHLSASTAAMRCRGGEASRDPAQRLLHSFGPMLALLAEPRQGGGILVRPRHHRIEVCTEHLVGLDLIALAVVFGAAVAAIESTSLRGPVEALSLDLVAQPSIHRFGWFLDPDTSLGHWYHKGRATPVRTMTGQVTTLGNHMQAVWELLRPLAASATSDELVRLVDERVQGAAMLPCERDVIVDEMDDDFEFRNVLGPHRFGRVSLECLAVTWTAAVFSVTDGMRTSLLTVPTAQLSSFLDQCEVDGSLPAVLSRQRRIRASVDTRRPRAQRRVDPSSLVPRERLPDGSMPPRAPGSGRSAKERSGEQQPHLRASARTRRIWPLIAAITGVMAVVVAGAAAVYSSRNDDTAKGAPDVSPTTLDAPLTNSTVTNSTVTTAAATSIGSVNTVDLAATAVYSGTGVFSSFSSGLSLLPAAQQEIFIPIESARGLYPSPQGETMSVHATLVGPCDGSGPCSAALSISGLAAGNALFRFSFLIDDFPNLTFELEPAGTGYRYSRAMGWNEAASIEGFDECSTGDPLHTLDLELLPNGDQLTGQLRATVDPLVISGVGGCWGIAYTIDIAAVVT